MEPKGTSPSSENPAVVPYSEPVQTPLLRFSLILSFHLPTSMLCLPWSLRYQNCISFTRFPIRATCDVHHYGIKVLVQVPLYVYDGMTTRRILLYQKSIRNKPLYTHPTRHCDAIASFEVQRSPSPRLQTNNLN
jgi:hypothetical protein